MSELKRLTPEQIKALPIFRIGQPEARAGAANFLGVSQNNPHLAFDFVDVCGLLDEKKDLLAIIAKEKIDNDFNIILLARAGSEPYRGIDMAVSIPTLAEAESKAAAMLREISVSAAKKKLAN